MSLEPTTATPDSLVELRQVFNDLLGTARRLRQRDPPTESGLTMAQLRATGFLYSKGEASAGELARVDKVNPATMSGMLDQLESADIVRRMRQADDRRVVVVSLTERGRRIVEEQYAAWDTRWHESLDDLTPDQVAAATHVMRRLVRMLSAMDHRQGHT